MLNSTQGLATTFGILGAVVLGDIATKTGIFSPEALVYLVFAAVSSFSVSNLQLGMATRLMRLTLVVLEWLWALPGIVVGLLFWFVLAVRSESLGIPCAPRKPTMQSRCDSCRRRASHPRRSEPWVRQRERPHQA